MANAEIHEQIEQDRLDYRDDPDTITEFRNYARGKHVISLSENQKELISEVLKHEFADNVCHQVISEAADRIIFLGWMIDSEKEQKFLSDLFTKGRLEDRTGEVHYDSLRDGNTVLVPRWNPKRKDIDIYREPWWDGQTGVFIGYDRLDNPKYAVKEWFVSKVKGVKRRVVWFDDRFERYISEDGGENWSRYNIPVNDGDDVETVEAKSWEVPWLKRDKSPLHIPFIHFPNSGRGSGNYGVSEIDGGVLGFQDQLNALQFALSAAGNLTAFQMLWATGVNLIDPATGERKELVVKPGTMFDSPNNEAAFGRIEAGDVSQIISIYAEKLKRVAQITRTPLHLITGGDWPSGEALLRAERPAVGKAMRQIKKFKSCYQTLAHRSIEIANANGGLNLNEEKLVTALLAPPQKYDLGALADVVSKVKDILSDEECLRKLEYTEEQIEKIMKEKEERDRKSAENAAISFSRGTQPGTQIKGMGGKTEDAEDDVTE